MAKEFPPSLSKDYPGGFDVYQKEAAAFLRAIRTGKPAPITLRDGRAAIEIILAAYHSQSLATRNPNFISRNTNYNSDPSAHPALK